MSRFEIGEFCEQKGLLSLLEGQGSSDELVRMHALCLMNSEIAIAVDATGIHSREGHRIVEISMVECLDGSLTWTTMHAYANRHLESLLRRYRLERIKDSYGLLVVDQDMSEEVYSGDDSAYRHAN